MVPRAIDNLKYSIEKDIFSLYPPVVLRINDKYATGSGKG